MTKAETERPAALDVRQLEWVYWTTFQSPAFELLTSWGGLFSAIHGELSSLDPRVGDIRVESYSFNPVDFSVACSVLGGTAALRFRLDRIEVWSTNSTFLEDSDLASRVAAGAAGAVRATAPSVSQAAHSLAISVHGIPRGVRAQDLLAPWTVETVATVSGTRPGGVSFVRDWPQGDSRGSLLLELSGAVESGLHLRVSTEHPGTLPSAEVTRRATEFLSAAAEAFGVRLIWGSDGR
jgi:hypothetical protein